MSDVLDETYQRLHGTGPEFVGWLSNHGPMAADALIRLGRGADVERWVEEYAERLDSAPEARWPIREAEWREPLGDPVRLGDWCALFTELVHREPWTDVLARWWPRLLPGAVAAATHGLIRTGHAVRALRERETPERLDELAAALGYWAARWQPLPGQRPPAGTADVGSALAAVPAVDASGGARTRIARLGETPGWPPALGRLRPVQETTAVPRELDALVDAAVSGYRRWAHGNPVMLVHAATAPRAAALVLPALPVELWRATYETAWAVSAAITGAYRPHDAGATSATTAPDADEVIDRAVATRDEHAIKFVEVARESHGRGNPDALAAGDRAARLLLPA
jgi:hypothetical protein